MCTVHDQCRSLSEAPRRTGFGLVMRQLTLVLLISDTWICMRDHRTSDNLEKIFFPSGFLIKGLSCLVGYHGVAVAVAPSIPAMKKRTVTPGGFRIKLRARVSALGFCFSLK